MPAPAALTGQDVGEAEGALTALLNQVLSNTDITRAWPLLLSRGHRSRGLPR